MELIERVKKVGDKMSSLESIFKLVEKSLIEVVDHLGIYNVRKHSDGTYSAGVETIEALEELANGAELKVEEFNNDYYQFEVFFYEDGVRFYKLITEDEYLKYFAPKEDPEDTRG